MGEFLKSVGAACAFVAALAGGVASARDKAPLVLEPTSQWHLDYADDSCRMVRIFGEGDNKSVFLIERYEPGDSFFLLVAGEPLKASRYADAALRFGPEGHEWEGPIQPADFGEYSPAVMANGMFLVTPPGLHKKGKEKDSDLEEEEAQAPDVFGQRISPEQEAVISWLEVRRERRRPVRLELGSMEKPMAAMRQCTDELLTHWGIDLEAHRGLSRAATPATDYTRWVRSSDYPVGLIHQGAQGIVQFRLSVGADGQPTQCHIQKSTRPEGFDKAVCKALMRRARFEPAQDADGQPIASYWRNTVHFIMP